MMNLK